MKLSHKSYAKVLYELTKDVKGKELDEIIKHFIDFLIKDQSISKIKYIIEEFVNYTKEKTGIKPSAPTRKRRSKVFSKRWKRATRKSRKKN